MGRIVVVGAGVAGLGAAMFLARDGHQVIVLERDPASPPDDPSQAWERWQRPGVNQFQLGHAFLAGFRSVVEAELPEVAKALQAAGGLRQNFIRDVMPETMTGGWRDGDERYEWLTGRSGGGSRARRGRRVGPGRGGPPGHGRRGPGQR